MRGLRRGHDPAAEVRLECAELGCLETWCANASRERGGGRVRGLDADALALERRDRRVLAVEMSKNARQDATSVGNVPGHQTRNSYLYRSMYRKFVWARSRLYSTPYLERSLKKLFIQLFLPHLRELQNDVIISRILNVRRFIQRIMMKESDLLGIGLGLLGRAVLLVFIRLG